MPREKADRGRYRSPASGSRSDGPLRDRETEALRAIVRALAREAAREAFERELAEQERGTHGETE